MIKWHIEKSPNEVAVKAAMIYRQQIMDKPQSVLGFATGSTPELFYRELIMLYQDRQLSFKECKSFNLDEYCGLNPSHRQSYHYYMEEKLFKHVDFDDGHIYLPHGNVDDYHRECKRYDALLIEHGPIDIQLLGIGRNGHIGFNEPNDVLIPSTHVVHLDDKTIKDNARFFSCEDLVPKSAITMGLKTIQQSNKILLLATGPEKAEILKALRSEKISTQLPASFLHLHADVTIICDESAAKHF
jgi:glucosamine-6-phosphate deaminase